MRAVPALRDLVRDYKPDVFLLFETLVHANKIEEIRSRIGFDFCFTMDRLGRSDSIVVLWKSPFSCRMLNFSQNFVNLEVLDIVNNTSWRLTAFYGYLERSRRRESWELIRSLSLMSQLPWCILGYFNDMLRTSDKKGRVEHPRWLLNGFRDVVHDCELYDLPLEGYQYTWSRGKGTIHAIEERIDRALVSIEWMDIFPKATLTTLLTRISDHSPLLLNLDGSTPSKKHSTFRFENSWLLEDSLQEQLWTVGRWSAGGYYGQSGAVHDKYENLGF